MSQAGLIGNSNLDPRGPYISLTPYIVGEDIHAEFDTIALAIAEAVSDGVSSANPANIYIKPKTGAYVENITLVDGINLIGFGKSTVIQGKITMSTAGTASINGLRLQTNSDFALAVTGSAATILNVNNCNITCSNNTGISYTSSSASSQLNLYQCTGNLSTTGIGIFSASGAGELAIFFSRFLNTGGSTTASTSSAGVVRTKDATFNSPVSFTGTSSLNMNYTRFSTDATNSTCLTYNSSGTATTNFCIFGSGTATAVVCTSGTITLQNCSVNSTNAAAISGAGTVRSANLSFLNTSSTISATTQTPLVITNDALKVVTPGAYPYTATPQDGLVLVDGSAARVINLSSSPATGQKHIIKDNSGSASGTNTITLTPAAGNIDGSATYVINVSYGSATIVYNGTQWNVT